MKRPDATPLLTVAAQADVQAILFAHETTLPALRSPSRVAELVDARRAVAFALQTHGYSTVSIGRFMWRDHSTVCNLLKKKAQ